MHPLAQADLVHQVHRRLLEHARAHAVLDVLSVARLEDHGLDPAQLEHTPEHQSGRPTADDRDLGLHGPHDTVRIPHYRLSCEHTQRSLPWPTPSETSSTTATPSP